ncbi:MAG: hypothetical protein LBJ32_03360 [Oscillospiraceae bacterium]|nr:hypothetical protein [Oscillospiraceae bacterium]
MKNIKAKLIKIKCAKKVFAGLAHNLVHKRKTDSEFEQKIKNLALFLDASADETFLGYLLVSISYDPLNEFFDSNTLNEASTEVSTNIINSALPYNTTGEILFDLGLVGFGFGAMVLSGGMALIPAAVVGALGGGAIGNGVTSLVFDSSNRKTKLVEKMLVVQRIQNIAELFKNMYNSFFQPEKISQSNILIVARDFREFVVTSKKEFNELKNLKNFGAYCCFERFKDLKGATEASECISQNGFTFNYATQFFHAVTPLHIDGKKIDYVSILNCLYGNENVPFLMRGDELAVLIRRVVDHARDLGFSENYIENGLIKVLFENFPKKDVEEIWKEIKIPFQKRTDLLTITFSNMAILGLPEYCIRKFFLKYPKENINQLFGELRSIKTKLQFHEILPPEYAKFNDILLPATIVKDMIQSGFTDGEVKALFFFMFPGENAKKRLREFRGIQEIPFYSSINSIAKDEVTERFSEEDTQEEIEINIPIHERKSLSTVTFLNMAILRLPEYHVRIFFLKRYPKIDINKLYKEFWDIDVSLSLPPREIPSSEYENFSSISLHARNDKAAIIFHYMIQSGFLDEEIKLLFSRMFPNENVDKLLTELRS